MTTTAHFINEETAAPTLAPVRIADGGRMVIRAAQRLFGAALAIAAIGLWLAPGASWENDVMLFKLILSVTALIAGLGLMQASTTPTSPQVEIDTIRREVRLVRPGSNGVSVLQRCAFGDLARVERKGGHVRLWGADNAFLAEMSLADGPAFKSLIAGLQDAGKLS